MARLIGSAFVLYLIVTLQRCVEKRFVSKNISKGRIIESQSLKVFKVCLYAILLLIAIESTTMKYEIVRSVQPWLRVSSVLLFVVGLVLRILAIKTLGKYWSSHVELKPNHAIVRDGIYRYCKHPAYVGNVYIVAIALFFEAILTSIVAVGFVLCFGLYRIRLEERYILEPLERERDVLPMMK